MSQSVKSLTSLPGAEPLPSTEGDDALPLSDSAREALLRRLEAWIEEEERLIATIERRAAAAEVLPRALLPLRDKAARSAG